MSDFVSQLVALGSLLDSGKLTQEEFNRSKLSLLPGTPVESPASSFIPLSSVTSSSTPTSASLKRPRSVLDQPWASVLDFGITKKMKAADGQLWTVKQRLSLRRTSWSTVAAMCIISYLVIQTRFK